MISGSRFRILTMGCAFMMGVQMSGVQYVILDIGDTFSMTQTESGALISLFYAANMVSPLLAGPLADRIGKKKITLAVLLLYTAAALLCLSGISKAIVALGMFAMGMGFGGLETTCQSAMVDEDHKGSGKMITLFQGLICVGCVIMPMILSRLLLVENITWRFHFLICGIGFLVLALLTIKTRFPMNVHSGKQTEKAGIAHILNRIVILCMLAMCFYMFAENAVTYFMKSFYTQVLLAPENAAVSLSLFWAAMAVSRIVLSRFDRYRKYILIICMAVSAALSVLLAVCHSPAAAVVIYAACGAAFAPIWPMLLSRGVESFPQRSGAVTSIMVVVSGAGGTVSPVLTGYICDGIGLRCVYFLNVMMFAAALLLFMILVMYDRKGKAEM